MANNDVQCLSFLQHFWQPTLNIKTLVWLELHLHTGVISQGSKNRKIVQEPRWARTNSMWLKWILFLLLHSFTPQTPSNWPSCLGLTILKELHKCTVDFIVWNNELQLTQKIHSITYCRALCHSLHRAFRKEKAQSLAGRAYPVDIQL